ncbi:hypothetical protein [Solilutibacter silvestris]|uniref:Lipoprotein SmpA/OmlA domain-containing protein n=1 Tax=Solilutibacter silvestris TaxID=1645665 RepID=A0A2K1PYK7_9GAMM|nr:hypothetical protein [Lysobacter silvestris]PNS07863.1 hypothetical protein Lysil_2039 [Lysobacter silvestris]
MRQIVLAAVAVSFIVLAPVAHARGGDTLLVDRVKQEASIAHPARGQTMAQVQQRFGAPQSKLDPRGGQKRDWPTINRWVYPQFTVYFQRERVLDVVVNKASADEVGPKPAVR